MSLKIHTDSNNTFIDPLPGSMIDVGTKKQDCKTRTLRLNDGEIALKDTETVNPFFVGIDGGSVLTMEYKEFRCYKNVYIMCLKDNIMDQMDDETRVKKMMNIFSRIIEKTDLKEICEIYTLIKTNSKILRNYSFKRKSIVVEKEMMNYYFPNLTSDGSLIDLIVLPIFELKESMVMLYLKMHGFDKTIHNIGNMLSLATLFNKKYTYPIDVNLINELTSIDAIAHWKKPENCDFNMDDIFNMRTLSYNGHYLHTIRYATLNGARSLNELLTSLDGAKQKTKITMIDNDAYHSNFNDEDEMRIKSEHLNISHVLRNSKNRTFYATVDEGQYDFTMDQIADIFDRITNEEYRFRLLTTLLVSKEYCHFVVNNQRVLENTADLFEKYKPLLAYPFGYACGTMYLEEAIFSTKSKKTNRFVTKIEVAEKLPKWPFSMENVHNNPYITLLLNRDMIDPKTNCMSIDSLENYNKHYGVCSKEEAFKRFNCFTTGKNGNNIFKGLDPKIFSFSGSIIPACLQKHSPLFDLCTDESMDYDDQYTTYFKHYYADADIDVMCGVKTLAEFFLHATTLLDTLCKNVECTRQQIKLVPNKKMAVVISDHFFKVCVDDLNNETGGKYTSDTLRDLFNNCLKDDNDNVNTLPQNIINYFYVDYVQEKNNTIKKWNIFQKQNRENNVKIDDEFFKEFNVITAQNDMSVKMVKYDLTEEMLHKKDSEIYYFVNDFMDENHKVPKEKNYLVFKFGESIKFKLEVEKVKRSIEIFMTNPVDPFNTVARFHLPCVRAYFQGNDIYMLPSFITAMMTGINIDYKYFATVKKNPVEIINKYKMRGFSVILNTNEKKSVFMYNKNFDEANGMFTVDDDDKYFGPKGLDDKIYKPLVFNKELKLSPDIYKKSNCKYIKTTQDLKNHYSKQLKYDIGSGPIDILAHTTISKNGNISPYKQWVVDAFYDFMQQKSRK